MIKKRTSDTGVKKRVSAKTLRKKTKMPTHDRHKDDFEQLLSDAISGIQKK